MPSWMLAIRDIVWTAVGSVVFTIASVLTAIFTSNTAIVVSLAGTAITFAILSQRD